MKTKVKQLPFKLLLSAAAACTMAFSALPAIEADAANDTYDLWIAGTEVTSANRFDILGDGVFRYDAETDTLHVSGSCTSSGPIIRRIGQERDFTPISYNLLRNTDYKGLTVCVDAESTLTSTDDYCIEAGGLSYFTALFDRPYRTLTITGEKLNLHGAGGFNGIPLNYTDEDIIYTPWLNVKDTELDIRTSGTGIHCHASVYGSTVHINSDTEAVSGYLELNESRVSSPADGQNTDYGYRNPDGTAAKELTIVPNKTYGLTVANTPVCDENRDDILGNGAFSYDPASNTLTISKGYSISKAPREYCTDNLIVCGIPDMAINVPANVSLTSDYATILINADTEITGEGMLMLTSTCGPGIEIADGCTLTVKDTALTCYSQVTHAIAGGTQYTAGLIVQNSDITARTEGVAAVNRLGSLKLRDSVYSNPSDGIFRNTSVYSESSNTVAKYLRIDRLNPVVPITEDDVTMEKTAFPYTGKAVKVGNYIKVRCGDTKLKYGTDFTLSYANNVGRGVDTASVTVIGIGNYKGSVTKYYSILGTVDSLSLSKTEFDYTGKAVKAGNYITVKSGSTKLKYGTDFTLTYKNNVERGVNTASVTATGIGNFTGSVTKYYSILGTVDSLSLSKTQYAYTGKQVKTGSYITVKSGDKKLKYGTDFTLSYANNVDCGANTASVTAVGIGEYKGSVTKYYTIVPVQQAAPKLSTVGGKLHIAWTKDTNAQGYQVQYCRSKDFTGDTLKTVAYATKTACDAAETKIGELWYVRVRAYVRNSSGTKYGTWSALSSLKVGKLSTVTLSQTEFAYTGKAVKVGNYITVKSGNRKLKYETDFTMTYKNNVNKGTATVTVTGIGEYSGSISVTYTIE